MTQRQRDPVCGMTVEPDTSIVSSYKGQLIAFCSRYCMEVFLAAPQQYVDEVHSTPLEPDTATRRIAYFSMEVAIEPGLPTYSGGLGVLAGDTLQSFADLKFPAVGVSLLYWKGFFDQILDGTGNQSERGVEWEPWKSLKLVGEPTHVVIAKRPVAVRAWRYDVTGETGYTVPLILLDTNFRDNSPQDRELTLYLYGGDERHRLSQEIVLGVGGIRMLRALGYTGIERFHMNEGHASLLALELLAGEPDATALWSSMEDVKRRCVFTTHTPVPAGHDRFSYNLVRDVLGEPASLEKIQMLAGADALDMTRLALNLSHYVNGVAKRHGEVSREMFPGYPIASITNGVHSGRWTCEPFRQLYDRLIPGWSRDPLSFRHAINIPPADIWSAHVEAKRRLLTEVHRRTGRALGEDTLTIGFARRATAYKRADLIFREPQRLLDMAGEIGPLQLIFAGKAHPMDHQGKDLIRRIFHMSEILGDGLPIVYLENYDMDLAGLLTSGTDLWLNTPRPPLEASGTSGMKAAHNGVPSLSVLDGWWSEGHLEGVTGWSVGSTTARAVPADESDADRDDAADLYQKLSSVILPLYYNDRDRWIEVMRWTVALNASFFNTHRMVQQYAANAYL